MRCAVFLYRKKESMIRAFACSFVCVGNPLLQLSILSCTHSISYYSFVEMHGVKVATGSLVVDANRY